MIIGDNREKVIQNIKSAANKRDFTAKVEIGDPVMSLKKRLNLVNNFWNKQNNISGKFNNKIGKLMLSFFTQTLSSSTKFTGLEHLVNLPRGGAIVTSNHFDQLDALTINCLAKKMHRNLSIVIEDTNLMLPGFFKYLMNYIGTIPLVNSANYIGNDFFDHLHTALDQEKWVLIYPEQEMWWNYRKPRKLQRGAYYFAAKQNVPIISIFVEIRNTEKIEKKNPNFYQTQYIVHVLPVIFPDVTLSLKANSEKMMQKDYQQKVKAYERIYQKKLDYDFTSWDIAGWRDL